MSSICTLPLRPKLIASVAPTGSPRRLYSRSDAGTSTNVSQPSVDANPRFVLLEVCDHEGLLEQARTDRTEQLA